MKTTLNPFASLILLFLITGFNVSANDTSVEHQAFIEESIRSQLKESIKEILPENRFAVFANIEAETFSQREPIESSGVHETTNAGPDGDSKPTIDRLPGFEDEAPDSKNEINQTSEKETTRYRYLQKDRIRKVSIRVLVDTHISTALFAEVKAITLQEISTFSGAETSVRVLRTDLEEPSLLARLTQMLPLIFGILLLSLGLVLLLMQVRAALKNSSQSSAHAKIPSQETAPHSSAAPSAFPIASAHVENANPALSGHLTAELTKTFVQLIYANPLVSRTYLEKLSDKSKVELIHCFDSGPFRAQISALMQLQLSNQTQSLPSSFDRLLVLNRTLEELRQFHELANRQLQQRFGSLVYLNEAETLSLLEGLEPKTLAVTLRYVSRDRASLFIARLSEIQRLEFLKLIRDFGKIAEPEIAEMELQVQTQVQHLSKEAIRQPMASSGIFELLIENSTNPQEVLRIFNQPSFSENFKHLSLGWKDFVALPPETRANILQGVENNDLAMALSMADLATSTAILTSVSATRRALLEAEVRAFNSAKDREKIRTGSKQVLRIIQQRMAA